MALSTNITCDIKNVVVHKKDTDVIAKIELVHWNAAIEILEKDRIAVEAKTLFNHTQWSEWRLPFSKLCFCDNSVLASFI